jgi:hypothetical protein
MEGFELRVTHALGCPERTTRSIPAKLRQARAGLWLWPCRPAASSKSGTRTTVCSGATAAEQAVYEAIEGASHCPQSS